MRKDLVIKPDFSKGTAQTVVVGLSCRNLKGFIFMWTQIIGFILYTKNAEGCLESIPGICSPFKVVLLSYWETPEHVTHFLRSKAHVAWMQFLYANEDSVNLFNEVYGAPLRGTYINQAAGYAAIMAGGPHK